ncbi:MAG: phosphate ABC transporter ATP-binding protein [Anaerolineae bacterium]|nr:phosphate ABC transporter ATP-binding protein [Anaerolineae bacterium]
MSEILYELREVHKRYTGRTVLQVSTLDIYRGEVLAIVGPSGAGKSTLLRLLNFLEFPDYGDLIYRGKVIQPGTMPLALRREVTTVFQRPALLSATVWRNVVYGLRVRGIRNGARAVQAVLARLGLAALTHAQARALSGGEAQRVALARALVLQPTVLLLDEPTANLDPYNVGIIEQVVADLNQTQGVTVVLVTHNVFQARRLAQRVVFLLNGTIVEVASAGPFFESPRDPRTAAFVNGEMVY